MLDIDSLTDSACADAGETGLGLTIARNIAENYGGTLILNNDPQGGLEVVLWLPFITSNEKKPA